MWAELFIDDSTRTFATPTTNYIPIAGSTLITGRAGSNEYIKVDPNNSTSARMVVGDRGKGVYLCRMTVCFSASIGNKTYHVAAHKNSSKLNNVSIERKIGTAGDIGAAAASGFVVLKNSTDYVDLRGQAETTGATITVNHFNLGLQFVTSSTKLGTING